MLRAIHDNGSFLLFLLVLVGCLAAGCSDPSAARRVAIRQENLRDQAEGAALQERHRAERLREVGPSVGEWWQRNVERFDQRSHTVGDYVW